MSRERLTHLAAMLRLAALEYAQSPQVMCEDVFARMLADIAGHVVTDAQRVVAAQAFLAAAETQHPGRIYNLGAGTPQSVNRLVELLGGEVVYIPKRPGEPDATWADINRITQELDWHPCVSFEQGVADIVADIDFWRDAPLWSPDSIADATKTWFEFMSPQGKT